MDFSAFFFLHPAKEMLEGSIQIAQGFLRRAFRDLTHPGKLGFLQAVELAVQIDCRGGFLSGLMGGDLALQSPIVGKARRTGMAYAGGSLLVVQIQFGLEGPQDHHRTIVLQITKFVATCQSDQI
jgi:hypothetical protein